MSSIPQKDIASSFLKMVVDGKVWEAFDRHTGPNFRHHNPYSKGDKESLIKAMEEADRQFKNKVYEIKRILEDGSLVAIHARLKLNDMDLAVLHIARFENGKIVEFWDMAQPIPKDSPNEAPLL